MSAVTFLHRYVAYSIPAAFALLVLWSAWAYFRNRDAGGGYWAVLAFVQVVLGVQGMIGLVLFLAGGRPQSNGPSWLHYVYGAVFPLGVLLFAHVQARRRPAVAALIFGAAAFVNFGLTFRALQTGLGVD